VQIAADVGRNRRDVMQSVRGGRVHAGFNKINISLALEADFFAKPAEVGEFGEGKSIHFTSHFTHHFRP